MIKTIAIAGLVALGTVSVADAMPVSAPSYSTPAQGIEKAAVVVKKTVVRRRPVARRRGGAKIIIR